MRLNEQQGRGGQPPDPSERITVVADPVTNSLIVRSKSAGQMRMVRSLVESLDKAGQAGAGIYVVPLKNAASGALAEVLSKIRIDTRDRGSAPQAGQAGSAGTGSDAGVTIVADEASNSLVISASESIYRKLRGVIDRLDVRRAQVYIEALLVEVQSDQAAEFGIQWITGLENVSGGGTSVIGGTNFGDETQNIGSAAQNLTNLGEGLNIGVIRGEVTIPGVGTITNLNFLARALEKVAQANILATPNILTLDNEEAEIIVGENIPVLTGQYVTQGAVSPNVNPFQTIERQDVGLTLRVKPQISEGGTIRLSLYQEASAVEDVVTNAGPVTRKRSLETNVLVDDGNIIVLGGLVQEELTDGTEKVPILGDIPLLGYLFRYDTRRRQKTNLMLFLRPYVIRNAEDSYSLTLDRYDMMRELEQELQPEPHFALPSFEGPILPELHLGQEPPANVPSGSATTPDTVE